MRVWQTGPNSSLLRIPPMEPSRCGSLRLREPRAHDHAIDGLLTGHHRSSPHKRLKPGPVQERMTRDTNCQPFTG